MALLAILTSRPVRSWLAALSRGTARGIRSAVRLVRASAGRQERTSLLDLDDRLLRDIGLARAEVLGRWPPVIGPPVFLRRRVEGRALSATRHA